MVTIDAGALIIAEDLKSLTLPPEALQRALQEMKMVYGAKDYSKALLFSIPYQLDKNCPTVVMALKEAEHHGRKLTFCCLYLFIKGELVSKGHLWGDYVEEKDSPESHLPSCLQDELCSLKQFFPPHFLT